MAKPLWRGQLFVHQIDGGLKYQDLMRVPLNTFKLDGDDHPAIKKHAVYRIEVNKQSVLVGLRGSVRPGIGMDLATRKKLNVRNEQSYHFNFYKAGFVGEVMWAWNATDPAYRIASRLGVVSLVLGLVGLILGVWSLWLALLPH